MALPSVLSFSYAKQILSICNYLAVNRSVADRLHSAAIHLLRRLRREDEAMGLTAARASALSVLVFGGRPVTLGALAQAEQVSAPTITRLIVGMERDGLVRREPDAARRPRRLAARHARKARSSCTPAAAAASPRSKPTWPASRRPSASTLADATGILERVLQGRGATGTTVATGENARQARHERTDEMMRMLPRRARGAAGGAGAGRDLGALAIGAAGRAGRAVDRGPAGSRGRVRVRAFDRDVAAYRRRRSACGARWSASISTSSPAPIR